MRSATPDEPLKLWSIEFGTGVDAQNQITGPTRQFTPQSTVFASITTKGTGSGVLTVEWATNYTIVETQTEKIDTHGDAHFAFHFVPADGWPKGTNRVRFTLDEGMKHVAEFQVD